MKNEQSPVQWLIEQFYNNEGILTTKKLEIALQMENEEMQTQYQDGRDSVLIEHIAALSTHQASSYTEAYYKGYDIAMEIIKKEVNYHQSRKRNEQR
jgi:hypothetical protein